MGRVLRICSSHFEAPSLVLLLRPYLLNYSLPMCHIIVSNACPIGQIPGLEVLVGLEVVRKTERDLRDY